MYHLVANAMAPIKTEIIRLSYNKPTATPSGEVIKIDTRKA